MPINLSDPRAYFWFWIVVVVVLGVLQVAQIVLLWKFWRAVVEMSKLLR